MNKKTKVQTKKIIIIILIVMLCNFIMPNYTYAYELNGGIFFKPIAQFIAHIADLVIQGLQAVCIGDGTMQVENTEYLIRYSPGIIFSGKLPMFDINFINPASDYIVKQMVADVNERKFGFEELGVQSNPYDLCNYNGILYNFIQTGELKSTDGTILWTEDICMQDQLTTTWEQGLNTYEYEKVQDILNVFGITTTENTEFESEALYIYAPNNGGPSSADVTNVIYNGVKYDCVSVLSRHYGWSVNTEEGNHYTLIFDYYALNLNSETGEGPYVYEGFVIIDKVAEHFLLSETGETIGSTAKQLRNFVATWYNVLKEVALVGLLVVLVYVAIRMILSSTAKDKAKYKKMLADWVVAVCIVFVLQYIISLTLFVTGAISDLFATTVVGPNEEDVLMTEIRNMIGTNPKSFMEVFTEIVMYVVLVVYTVLFTIQYLKRTIYMAFLTLISPLVAFTYPLDKLKDGKAQAFSTWLKEFIYSALVQPVHLILYSMLVATAIEFAKEIPVYAIIVIGFLLQAEKFVKKMFGLDKANTVGNMAAAVGGATVMNALNKLGLKGPKGKGAGKAGASGGNSNVRTANPDAGDPYDVLRDGTGGGGANPGGNPPRSQNPGGNQPSPQYLGKGKRKIKNGPSKGNGFWNVTKKYVLNKNVGKSIIRGTGKLAGAATLGTIGFAAGIATGEIENAFTGAIGGLTAGNRVGGNLVDGGANLIGRAGDGLRGLRDTFEEGAYGEETFARMKFDREFKKSEGYIKLLDKYHGKENDVQEFLNAGITDTKMMEKAFEKGYDVKEAIAYMKMANVEDCPDTVLYDPERFRTYLTTNKIVKDLSEPVAKIKAREEKVNAIREAYRKDKNLPKKIRKILDNEEKFTQYLLDKGEIGDLAKEISKVKSQTRQIEEIRKKIVDFK